MFTRALAVALVMLALAPSAGGEQAPKQEDAPPAAPRVTFVSPDWVSTHADDPSVRILDLRPELHAYFSGHVLNAVHLADSNLRGPERGLPAQLLPPEFLAALLGRAGVTPRHRVVLYSDGEGVLGATLAAYVLEKLGHMDIRVMDGGWGAYRAGRITQAYPYYGPGTMPVRLNERISVSLEQLRGLLKQPGVVFVDAQPGEAYQGESIAWMRNGHIPGAISLPWDELVDPDNPHKLKPADELHAIVSGKGLRPSGDVVVYGGTSWEASLVYVALKHLLGFPRVRLYEGSWAEYAGYPDLPVATGPTRGGGELGGAGREGGGGGSP